MAVTVSSWGTLRPKRPSAARNSCLIRGIAAYAEIEGTSGWEEGAGAHGLVEGLLADAGAAGVRLSGPEARGHVEVAQLVRSGAADVGVAIESVALAHGLGFVPLREERFDLVVADLSGPPLDAVLAGGVDVLKVSDDQLRRDGYLSGEDRDDVRRAIDKVRTAGASNVVVSRSRAPSIAAIDDAILELRGPDVDPVDSHGGGDSMTGALATALACGRDWETALRLAVAAGIAGVLRHGLASARRQDIEHLARQVTITPLD